MNIRNLSGYLPFGCQTVLVSINGSKASKPIVGGFMKIRFSDLDAFSLIIVFSSL
jgi:hypothetical protein